MDFYDTHSDDISSNFIALNPSTTDLHEQDNSNTSYILSVLSTFKDLKHVPLSAINEFNENINQRIVWENIIIDDTLYSRISFNMNTDTNNYEEDVPYDYFITYENDPITNSCLNYFVKYLDEKYDTFDFLVMNDILSRMQHFQSFDYIFKVFNMMETLLPLMIKKYHIEIMDLFGDIPLIEKVKKSKEKSSIGIIWNMCMEYLTKCDQDLYVIFEIQKWEFISSYILKNIM